MKNNVKLIMFDMDGTLLTSEKKVPDEFEEIFYKLKDQGITLGISSGRPFANLQKVFSNIHKDMVFICDNGGLVAYKEKVISVDFMPRELVTKIIKKTREIKDCSLLLCTEKNTYHEHENDVLMDAASKYYPNLVKVDDLEKVEEVCVKMTIYDYKGSANNTYPALKGIDKDLAIACSAKDWCDVNNAHTSKATGAKALLDYMNLSFDQLMVFGDEGNDYEILKAAKYSVAMENAVPKVKAICSYICDSNDQNGVIKMLKETFL